MTPGSWIRDPGCSSRIRLPYFRELGNNFLGKKTYPGSGMEKCGSALLCAQKKFHSESKYIRSVLLFIFDSLMIRPVNDEEPVGVRPVAVAAVSPQQRNIHVPGPALHVLRRPRLIHSQLANHGKLNTIIAANRSKLNTITALANHCKLNTITASQSFQTKHNHS
jgi:hypothetical protein